MPNPFSSAQLHARRRQLLSQIEDLDQIRRGSITEQFVESVRKDGQKVRRGPYTLFSFKDKGGRTVSRRLSDPAQIAHYRAQIEAFRHFQQCTAELLALGEALSDRAIEDPDAQKKNACHQTESQDEIGRIMTSLQKARDQGEHDLEAWEEAIRNAVLRHGASLLEGLLAEAGCGRRKEPLLDVEGHPMHSLGVRRKTITTLLGKVTLRRSVFEDAKGGHTRIPLDENLGVEGTCFSPGVRRFMARAGSRSSFADASEDLCVYARLEVTAKQVQRVAEDVGRLVEDWTGQQVHAEGPGDVPAPPPILYVSFDGTGIPMRRAQLLATKGKGADGKARTREVKLGCVFTQTDTDEEGWPVRDPDSTTYVGAIESSELFGLRIYQEAVRRGCGQAGQIVVLSDGARYNKTITSNHFPAALHIIDLYHAREHLTDLANALGSDEAQLAAWNNLLDMGRVEDIIAEAISRIDQLALNAQPAEDCRKRLCYFRSNAEAMRYAQFRLAGYFVGSGVVEAGCRTVIGQRLKHSGMFWSLRGANAIIASRCCQLSGRFDDFWEDTA